MLMAWFYLLLQDLVWKHWVMSVRSFLRISALYSMQPKPDIHVLPMPLSFHLKYKELTGGKHVVNLIDQGISHQVIEESTNELYRKVNIVFHTSPRGTLIENTSFYKHSACLFMVHSCGTFTINTMKHSILLGANECIKSMYNLPFHANSQLLHTLYFFPYE